jgi:hypothetical protein
MRIDPASGVYIVLGLSGPPDLELKRCPVKVVKLNPSGEASAAFIVGKQRRS